jgi:hypothetical protein
MPRRSPKSHSPVKEFFEKTLPARFAEVRDRLTEDQKKVRISLGFRLLGKGGGEYSLRMEGGELTIHPSIPAEGVDLRITQPWEHFLATLQGEGGLGDPTLRMYNQDPTRLSPLLAQRIQAIRGTIRFSVLVGEEENWWLLAQFGDNAPEEPQTRVTIAEADARLLRSGSLNPQQAFMAGKIRILGDMNLALQVGSLTMIR